MKLGAAGGYGSGIGAASDEGWRDVCACLNIYAAARGYDATLFKKPSETVRVLIGVFGSVNHGGLRPFQNEGF
ncbi:MAG: hypothetical protein ACJAQU_001631 [Loktanella salsilacus]|jgi:hypothetical protein